MAFQDYREALSCGIEAWSGFWGDPLLTGSLAMASFAFAAIVAFRASRTTRSLERVVWTVSAAIMAFQVLNTPLDLHGLAWATGRCLAKIQGWYDLRYAYQREILIWLALAGGVLLVVTSLALRRDFLRNAMLVLGVLLVVGMTLAKGVNYHHLERFYNFSIGPLAMPDIVELAGIALVVIAALSKLRSARPAARAG